MTTTRNTMQTTLGAYLKGLRKAMWKVSLEDMAGWIGTSKGYLYAIENDQSMPTLSKAKLIAKHYKTTLNKMGEFV